MPDDGGVDQNEGGISCLVGELVGVLAVLIVELCDGVAASGGVDVSD